MADQVLFVDDEPSVLDGLTRKFRRKLNMVTAVGPEAGLVTLTQEGPFAVVVSDFKMPVMDGIHFLNCVRDRAPEAARILLTGYADVSLAMKAVNEGSVFRFLSKPCPDDLLYDSIKAGMQHHYLLRMEKDLLSLTLVGTLGVLTESLSYLYPREMARVARVRGHVRDIGKGMGLRDLWPIEVAALLAPVERSVLPPELRDCVDAGEPVSGEVYQVVSQHADFCGNLIKDLPHLSDVADILRCRHVHYSGDQSTVLGANTRVPVGARVLKLAADYDMLLVHGLDPDAAFQELTQRTGWYDPTALDGLQAAQHADANDATATLAIHEISTGMRLAGDVVDTAGNLVLSHLQPLTDTELSRLRHLATYERVPHTVSVLIPK